MRERRAQPAANDDGIELTQTLRSLRVPVVANDPEVDESTTGGKVMLLCRDSGSRKWAPRWLSQAGLEVRTPSDHRNALTIARDERPDLVIVEAGLDGVDDQPLYRSLLDAADLGVPVMVMCTSAREIASAVEAEPFDIVRKPYEWQVIARRTRAAIDLHATREQLADSKRSLEKALEIADVARIKLRSRESFEPVTGLPNKTKFNDLLTRGMAAVDRDGNKLAVFVVGFNRFRLVVEAMGQEHADLILAEVG